MQQLDRDYDEYRREHQSQFEQEFGGWRERRQNQRQSLRSVTEHMEVMGSDGEHIGTVDKVRGDRIILTKSDRSEEHTSELQSLMRISYAVFCLKKKTNKETHNSKQMTRAIILE